MFKIEYNSPSRKFLKKADKKLAERIIKKLEEIKENIICQNN